MKIEKNKIVFASVLAIVVIFIVGYSILVMSDGEPEGNNLKQTLVPELTEDQNEYESKLDAINDLKKVRERNAPSIYDETLIDSLGFYDPELTLKEKERIVDSIYEVGKIKYSTPDIAKIDVRKRALRTIPKIDSSEIKKEKEIEVKEMGLEHQLFFASARTLKTTEVFGKTDATIYTVVDGDQVVKVNSRLRMRLTQDAFINGKLVNKNTPIFGLVKFQPNRALVEIENIQHHPTQLKAFDLQDGSEGIYVENNFRAEATNEVLDDIIQDINIPSVPQVGGVTKVLRRNNRNVKVTVLNNYKLILKPEL